MGGGGGGGAHNVEEKRAVNECGGEGEHATNTDRAAIKGKLL